MENLNKFNLKNVLFAILEKPKAFKNWFFTIS